MPWPSDIDYSNALQNPKTAFNDPALASGVVEADKLGLPKARAGNFAIVFKVTSGGTAWAVRCFKRDLNDRRERYLSIGQHLKSLNLPILLPFEYIERGVRVNGEWFPVLKMEWIQGELLTTWLERNLASARSLRHLALALARAASLLRQSRIGHGDLQHGNIVIHADGLRLIDYDSMFVPSLNGKQCPELGHENYQHPLRNESHFGNYIDTFSIWVIYTSLLLLSLNPTLWKSHANGQEAILFRRPDFISPSTSTLFGEVIQSPDARVRLLGEALLSLLAQPPEDLPQLEVPVMHEPDVAVVPCPSCRNLLRLPLSSDSPSIHCDSCGLAPMCWGQGHTPAISNPGGEWWRQSPSSPTPNVPSLAVHRRPLPQPQVTISTDPSLWKPAESPGSEWILSHLDSPLSNLKAGPLWLERGAGVAGLFCASVVAVPLSDPDHSQAFRVFLFAAPGLALGLTLLLWYCRYINHPWGLATVQHRTEMAQAKAGLSALALRRESLATGLRNAQMDLDGHVKRLLGQLSEIEDRRLADVRAACTPELHRFDSLTEALAELSRRTRDQRETALGPLDQKTQTLQRHLSALSGDLARRNADISNHAKAAIAEIRTTAMSRERELRQNLGAAATREQDELQRATQQYKDKAAEQSLRQSHILSADISGLGTVLLHRLLGFGIRTASDASYHSLGQVPGFGTARINAVLEWRGRISTNARNRAGNLPADEATRIRQRWSTQCSTWQAELNGLTTSIQSRIQEIQNRQDREIRQAQAIAEQQRNTARAELFTIQRERSKLEAAIIAIHSDKTETLKKEISTVKGRMDSIREVVNGRLDSEREAILKEIRALEQDSASRAVAITGVLVGIQAEELQWQHRLLKLRNEAQHVSRYSIGRYVRAVLLGAGHSS